MYGAPTESLWNCEIIRKNIKCMFVWTAIGGIIKECRGRTSEMHVMYDTRLTEALWNVCVWGGVTGILKNTFIEG